LALPVAQPSLIQAAVNSERMIFSEVMPSAGVFRCLKMGDEGRRCGRQSIWRVMFSGLR